MTIFGVPPQLLFGQLLLGLINGSFYAVLSLGLAVIFGMLNIINFAHGAQYMVGAFVAWIGLAAFGVNYWESLLLALLLTFGLALIAEGVFRNYYGISGESYEVPEQLQGGMNLGFMFLPLYRAWVVVAALGVCFAVWFAIERTRLGATLRAATQRPDLVQALGINVPLLMTLTYAAGLGLVEALTKVYYPQASAVVIFLMMVIVLMVRPAGLFGRQA